MNFKMVGAVSVLSLMATGVLAQDATITLPQKANTKGGSANTVDIEITGSGTTIGAAGDFVQEGDNNAADIDINGNGSTIYFAQKGNSLLTLSLDGDTNMVTVNEFGGVSDRRAEMGLSIEGSANMVELARNDAFVVAQLMDISLDGDQNFVQVDYSDFAEIVADITGSGTNLRVNQRTSRYQGASANSYNSVEVTVEAYGNGNNRIDVWQNGVDNAVEIEVRGSENRVYTHQYGDGGAEGELFVEGSNNYVDTSSYGYNNNGTDYTFTSVNGEGNNVSSHQSGGTRLTTNVDGKDNYVHAGLDQWGSDKTIEMNLDVHGSQNHLNIHSNNDYSRVSIRGDNNNVYESTWGQNSTNHNYSDTYVRGDNNRLEKRSDMWGSDKTDYSNHTRMYGSDNSMTLTNNNRDGGYTYVHALVHGEHNTTDISSVGRHTDVHQGGYHNNVDVSGDRDNTFVMLHGEYNKLSITGGGNGGSVDVHMDGSRNSTGIDHVAGGRINYNLNGSGFETDVSYDADLGIYVHAVNVQGSGNVSMSTDDGRSNISIN